MTTVTLPRPPVVSSESAGLCRLLSQSLAALLPDSRTPWGRGSARRRAHTVHRRRRRGVSAARRGSLLAPRRFRRIAWWTTGMRAPSPRRVDGRKHERRVGNRRWGCGNRAGLADPAERQRLHCSNCHPSRYSSLPGAADGPRWTIANKMQPTVGIMHKRTLRFL